MEKLLCHLAGNQPKQKTSSSGLKWQAQKAGRRACKNKNHIERSASLPTQLANSTHVHQTQETEVNVTEYIIFSIQHTCV
jgi:hypothetical protein